jgi:ubiquitin-protein ligase E3 A
VDEVIDLICGKEDLDFKELERSTRYEGFDKEHQVVKWFWEVLHSFDPEQKKRFLLFSTGSDRSPLRGLKDLRFILSRQAADDLRIPSTHTCFNHFLLPEYSSKEVLREKLLQAMENCQGFGLM